MEAAIDAFRRLGDVVDDLMNHAGTVGEGSWQWHSRGIPRYERVDEAILECSERRGYQIVCFR